MSRASRSLSCSLVLVTALLVFLPAARAQNPLGNLRPDACDVYEAVAIPAGDLPTDADRQGLVNCKSEDLYYGFDHEPDFGKARLCAYVERAQGKKEPDLVFGGAALLTMIYANGKGAARNFDLALKFACQSGWAPVENLRRFNHLVELKERNWTGDTFSICDDITSGFMSGACASIEAKAGDARRARKLASITAGWSPEQKQAFTELQKSAEEFVEARADNEIDLSGTAHAEFQYEEQQALRDDFTTSLQEFESGKLPSASPDDFKQADSTLNSIYKNLDGHPDNAELYGTVTPVGVRKVERVWLHYRDAWVKFGGVKYPAVNPDSWRTWLTNKRIEMLKDLSS